VGVLAYELVAGCPPFYSEDRMAMYEAIVHVRYTFPRHFSPELSDLVSRLLVRNPAFRLTSPVEIKRHPFFKSFDWGAFGQRQLKPPYQPKVGLLSGKKHGTCVAPNHFRLVRDSGRQG
jgi:serine/threonine protein kinase